LTVIEFGYGLDTVSHIKHRDIRRIGWLAQIGVEQ